MENRPTSGHGPGDSERYRTLLEINNAVISSLTQDALFHAIAGALRRVVAFDRTALFLHDPRKQVLRLFVLESSLPSDYFEVGFEVAPEDSHVGWVFRHRQPLLRRDLETERQYPAEDLALADGVRSYVVVPLIARGTSIGALGVASTKLNQYSQADVVLFQEAANQIALAVENMKAYEEITALNAGIRAIAERHRTLLEINNAIVSNLTREALFQAIARALRRVVPADRTALFLHDPERDALRLTVLESTLATQHFVVGWEQASHQSPAGRVFQQRQPLVRHDLAREREDQAEELSYADGVRSYAILPLLARGRAIGVLTVSSTTPHQYSDADLEFLQEVAGQVALAVENMNAYEEIAALTARLQRENVYLQEEIQRGHDFVEMVGSSPPLLAVLRKVEQVATTNATVLISGETGTGKELIAHAIHSRSARKDRPLVKVNCSAISAGLAESELFGHVKGAFTGAIERRVGRFELADGGTLFLDEVGELPPETQSKLLRVLQEQEFEPVGSSRTLRVDVRVIAATNRDLTGAVREGRFRDDLYYRLNVFPIQLPPLRERRADIPQLVMFFLSRNSKELGKKVDAVSTETMDRLVSYPWPGNIRELQNVIERAVVLAHGPVLELDHELLPAPGASVPVTADETAVRAGEASLLTLEEVERHHILEALKQTGGVIEGPKGAARLLAIHSNTLRSRMEKLGIRRPSREMS